MPRAGRSFALRLSQALLNAVLLAMVAAVLLRAPNLSAAQQGESAPPWHDWRSHGLAVNPLVGRIWSTAVRRFITPQELAAALASTRFALIGETHDNPDHHRLQAWLIAQMAALGRRPAVVMEMIREDKADALQAYLARADATATGLGPALGWQKSGWPDWRIYQPVADAALTAHLPIFAGDAARARIHSVGRKGLDALSAPERRTLALGQALPAQMTQVLLDELYDSHCRLLPRAALAPMAAVQRFRDAVLADNLLRAGLPRGRGAVLIAGNGHVRSDRAVPWYLRHRLPGTKALSVMLIEVEAGANKPEALISTGPDGKPAADFAWFTPRAARPDPCVELAKRFGKHRKPGAGK